MITDKTTATATESYTSIDTPFNSLHAKNNAGEALKNGVFSAIEKEQQVIGVVGAQKRDKLYSLLLSDYITELKTDKLINRKLKYFTFIIMMLVFSLLTVGLVGFVAFLSIKGVGNDTADIVLSVSCCIYYYGVCRTSFYNNKTPFPRKKRKRHSKNYERTY